MSGATAPDHSRSRYECPAGASFLRPLFSFGLPVGQIHCWTHDITKNLPTPHTEAAPRLLPRLRRQDIRDWLAETRDADRLIRQTYALQHRQTGRLELRDSNLFHERLLGRNHISRSDYSQSDHDLLDHGLIDSVFIRRHSSLAS